MVEQAGGSKLGTFIRHIRGSKGELGLLLRLVGQLRQRWQPSRGEEPMPAAQRAAIGLLRARIADLSRASEKKMREAAINVGRIGKAFQEQKAHAETVRQFGPILALLQKQIEHSKRKVQAGKATVQELNSLLGAADEKRAAGATKPAMESAGARPQQAPRRSRRRAKA